MTSVADAPLASLAREADPATVTAFVADLYEERGWRVESRGDREVVVSDGDRAVHVAVIHPAATAETASTEGADRVVVVDDTADVDFGEGDVVDAAALSRQLAYAIDREEAVGLLETHFQWSGETDDSGQQEGPDAGTDETGAETARERRVDGTEAVTHGWWNRLPSERGRWQVIAGAVLVVVLLAGTAVALSGDDSRTGGPTTDASGDLTRETPSTSLSTRDGATGDGRDDGRNSIATSGGSGTGNREVRVREAYQDAPPGIVAPNEIYIHRVAGAYQEQVANTSYRLTLTYREFVDGRSTGVYTETIRVETTERYSVRTSRYGALRTDPLSVAGTDLYANGSVEFERLDDGTVRTHPTSTYDPFMVNSTEYLGWFFSVRNSSIAGYRSEGDTRIYHIVTTGDPNPAFRNATGSVFMTEDGVVRDGRWEYVPADSPEVRVVFRMQVSDVGETTVRPPDWVETGE